MFEMNKTIGIQNTHKIKYTLVRSPFCKLWIKFIWMTYVKLLLLFSCYWCYYLSSKIRNQAPPALLFCIIRITCMCFCFCCFFFFTIGQFFLNFCLCLLLLHYLHKLLFSIFVALLVVGRLFVVYFWHVLLFSYFVLFFK